MGWAGRCAAMIAIGASLAVACSEPTATGAEGGDSTPSPSSLPLAFAGNVLHEGDYCHFLQQVAPGNNTLPVIHGCQFNLTRPADVFGTDGSNYSVSEVIGEAKLGVRGPADARVMISCRLSPRAQFWFWVSADGHWNIDSVVDVHNPQELVAAQDEEPLRQYVSIGGNLNRVQFKCAAERGSRDVSLALNMNGHQFVSFLAPMPAASTPLTRPATPWFVDVAARLTSPGTLEGTAAAVLLYESE